MSYWPKLLIETYHLLKEVIKECPPDNQCSVCMRLDDQANKIKKRMKSLGYHDCWEKEDSLEVELP